MTENVVLRKATIDDAELVFNVRNQFSARNASWNNTPLVWKDHKEWFKKNYSFYWIIEKNRGFVRLKDGEISIALFDKYQNMGIGTKVLKDKRWSNDIRAEVKLDNLQSLYCFLNAGFRPVGFILWSGAKK